MTKAFKSDLEVLETFDRELSASAKICWGASLKLSLSLALGGSIHVKICKDMHYADLVIQVLLRKDKDR